MKRGLVVAIGGAAIVAAGLTGCGDKASQSVGKGTAKVTIDGKDKSVSGTVGCQTAGGSMQIALGNSGDGSALQVVLSPPDPPTVQSVQLGKIDGMALQVVPPATGDATATKDGKKYTIKGNAGDPMNPTAAKKPFEIVVECP